MHIDPTKYHTLFRDMQLSICSRCGKGYVPSVFSTLSPHIQFVLATSEIPVGLETVGDPVFIQSCVTERKTDLDTRENGANQISRLLPFVEVRLYNQLLVKLQSLRCNAVFGLSVEMEIGGSLLAATVTGTAVYIPGLPEPGSVSIRSPFPPTKNESCENYEHVTVGVSAKSER